MIKASLSIVVIVLVVAVASFVHFNSGVEGNVVYSGPVCCTVSPVSQASYGYGQLDAVTRTVYCEPVESLQLCCFRRMSELLQSYVKVDGAHPGECGSQNIFRG